MKTIVVYKSKYGYTKKYAEWIAEALQCDIKENAKLGDLAGYDRIICGGGVYAGMLSAAKLVTKNIGKLSGKELILFAVGANSGEDKEKTALFWNRILTGEQQKRIGHFWLRGGFDFGKLNRVDRFIMNLLKKHLQKIKEPDEETKGMLSIYDTPVDFTDRENLEEMLRFINKNGGREGEI